MQPSIEGIRTSYSWRHRSSSLDDSHKALFSGTESVYLSLSMGGNASSMAAESDERKRNDLSSEAATVATATSTNIPTTTETIRESTAKPALTTPCLLHMLAAVPADKDDRISPTSVTEEEAVPSADTPPTAMDDAATDSTFHETDEAKPTMTLDTDASKSDDSVDSDDDDDYSNDPDNTNVLNSSSSRKSMQIATLELALEQAQAQRSKMLKNIQRKKHLVTDAHTKLKTLETENISLKQSVDQLSHENVSLHTGLAKVTAVRDELRNKLRIKQDVLRETRVEKDDMEKKLKRSEQNRLLEQELLANYRRLAIHTGYFKWGKEIRMLEAALEKANAEQQQE